MSIADLSSWGKMTTSMPKGWTGHVTGNEEHATLSEFPFFKDADVKIMIGGYTKYQLHSHSLKAMSPFFNKMLTDQDAAKLTRHAIKTGIMTRFRLKTVQTTKGIGFELVKVLLDDDGKPLEPQGKQINFANGLPSVSTELALHAVLGAFYNQEIKLDSYPTDPVAASLDQATKVLEVAEYLQVVQIILKPVEATLLAKGQGLYRSIASIPAQWLDFSYRMKSGCIFREALIHSVGQFNTAAMERAMEKKFDMQLKVLLIKKVEHTKESVQRAQRLILSYYPNDLHRQITVGRADKDNIGRASYGNDIFKWMALVAYRHWVDQLVVNNETHQAEDMGYAVMTMLSKGGDEYLDKQTMLSFHRIFPTSGKGGNVIEDRITDIKEHIKQWAKPLLKNNSQLDVNKYPTGFFTHSDIEFGDYPWQKPMSMAVLEEQMEEEEDLYSSD